MNFLWNLDYFVLGELITCVLSFILCCNIFVTFSFYDKRQRYFCWAAISSFLAAFFDITSAVCISYIGKIPTWVGTISSTLFYTFLIAIPFFISCYAIEIAFAYRKKAIKNILLCSIILWIIYFVIIIANIFTGIVFKYDVKLGYVRGVLNLVAYVMTGIFALIIVVSVLLNKKNMANRLYWAFLAYPFISLSFILIQYQNNKILLTGISSFAALLVAYLGIQSDLIEYDSASGLMTEKSLHKRIASKKGKGALYVLAINNIRMLHTNMDVSKFNTMLLDLGKKFSEVFEGNAYHISTSRFAGIGKTLESVVEKGNVFEQYLKNIVDNSNLSLPTSLEFDSAAISLSAYNFTYSTLMDVINTMLKKAKKSGSHSIQVCDESIIATSDFKKDIVSVLEKELNKDSKKLKVVYQPIYSFKDKKYTYAEALARIVDTEIGDIYPSDFIPIIESKGLIEKFGNLILDKVCKFLAANRGVIGAVSINVSVYQLANSNFVNNILTHLKEYMLGPESVIIEVTENIFNDDYYFSVLDNMNRLSEMGIKFHLDNFGMGKSNVQDILKLPFSTIKLDKSLLENAVESSSESTLFSGFTKTFRSASFNVVAECIETRKQLIIANKAGVDYVQGYLSCSPLSSRNCIEFLRKKN